MSKNIHPEGEPLVKSEGFLIQLAKKEGRLLRKELARKTETEALEQQRQEQEDRDFQQLKLSNEIDYSPHFSKRNRQRIR